MTLEDHLRRMIGDHVLTIARLAADNDALAEKVKALEAAAAPRPPSQDAGVQS